MYKLLICSDFLGPLPVFSSPYNITAYDYSYACQTGQRHNQDIETAKEAVEYPAGMYLKGDTPERYLSILPGCYPAFPEICHYGQEAGHPDHNLRCIFFPSRQL